MKKKFALLLLFFIPFPEFVRQTFFFLADKGLRTSAYVSDVILSPFQTHKQLRNKLEILEKENQGLLAWKIEHQHVVEENKKLKEMLHFVPQKHHDVYRLFSFQTPFIKTTTLLYPGSAVVGAKGLWGKVVAQYAQVAYVMPLTHKKSRISVYLERTGEAFILEGTGSDLELKHQENNLSSLKEGDKFFTQRVENFLPDLPVATLGPHGKIYPIEKAPPFFVGVYNVPPLEKIANAFEGAEK